MNLADKILELKNNQGRRDKIAENGYQFYLKYLTPQATGAEFKLTLEKLINKG